MSERAALIHSIQCDPASDTPRLICADWLEEHGGEADKGRAEFIRLQIARANLPEDDIRQSEMFAEEIRLLKKYQHIWTGRHFAFKKCIFRRGFIEYVHLHLKHYLHHRRQLHALEPISDLRLTGFHRAKDHLVERVARCEELRYIRSLKIHFQGPHQLPRANVLLLLESPHLVQLQHFGTPVLALRKTDRLRFEQLPLLARLRSIDLPDATQVDETRGSGLNSDRPGYWFDEGASATDAWTLERLSVFVRYRDEGRFLHSISQSPFWAGLTELSLSGDEQLAPSLAGQLPQQLSKLKLSLGGRQDSQMMDQLAQNLCHVPLETLAVEGTAIAAERLHELLRAVPLKSLALHNYDEAQHKVVVDSGARLQELDLGWEPVADDKFDALVNSSLPESLVRLNLSKLTDRQARCLGGVTWPRLRFLKALETGTTSAALAHAISPDAFPNLNWLFAGCQEPWDIDLRNDLVESCLRLPHLVGASFQYRTNDDEAMLQTAKIPYSAVGRFEDYNNAIWRITFDPKRWPACDDGYEQMQDWI